MQYIPKFTPTLFVRDEGETGEGKKYDLLEDVERKYGKVKDKKPDGSLNSGQEQTFLEFRRILDKHGLKRVKNTAQKTEL